MKAVKSGYRAFTNEFKSSLTLLDKAEQIKKRVPLDFERVGKVKDEISNILSDIPEEKKPMVIQAWQKDIHDRTEAAKKQYLNKYIPSILTGCATGFFAVYISPAASEFPIFLSVVAGPYLCQQFSRTEDLRLACKIEKAVDFVVKYY